jgi:hypothetical protein
MRRIRPAEGGSDAAALIAGQTDEGGGIKKVRLMFGDETSAWGMGRMV